MKKFLGILMVSIMLLSGVCMSVGAATASLHWEMISDFQGELTFSNNVGYFTSLITCDLDVTKIETTATLYYINSRGNRSKITDWTYTVNDFSLDIDENFTAVSEREYVVVVDITAYTGSSSETASKTFSNTCP